MITRPFGSTGLKLSALGLGCNNFGGRLDLERTRRVVDAALAAGITFIDTADVYGNRGGSERLLGETLAAATRRSCWRLSSDCRWTMPVSKALRAPMS